MKKLKLKKQLENLHFFLYTWIVLQKKKISRLPKIFFAWKGYDFSIINELDDEDFIYQGKYKNKSVYITEKGIEEAKNF